MEICVVVVFTFSRWKPEFGERNMCFISHVGFKGNRSHYWQYLYFFLGSNNQMEGRLPIEFGPMRETKRSELGFLVSSFGRDHGPQT